MTTTVPHRHLVTEEEFLALPETNQKVELLDGEVIVAPAPSSIHQELVTRLLVALRLWAGGHRHDEDRPTVLPAPLDIRFLKDRILQPDIAVFLSGFVHPASGPIDRIPDLCVEVLSSDRVYDRVTKRMVYGAAGVREYWVAERGGLVERWSGDGLGSREEVTTVLRSTLLPGFELDLAALRDL